MTADSSSSGVKTEAHSLSTAQIQALARKRKSSIRLQEQHRQKYKVTEVLMDKGGKNKPILDKDDRSLLKKSLQRRTQTVK